MPELMEEKYDKVRGLISLGKERGYLLYDELNDVLPDEVRSSEEIDGLLSTLERYGIDLYETQQPPGLLAPKRNLSNARNRFRRTNTKARPMRPSSI